MKVNLAVEKDKQLPKFLLTDGTNNFDFEDIDKIIPERANQLLAFLIKERIEAILLSEEYKNQLPTIKEIRIVCKDGIPMKARIVKGII